MAKVLIVCGGTGGHLTPGIAIAEELLLRGCACTLVVSRKKVDARLIRNYPNLEFVEAPGAPFSWNPLPLVKFLWVQTTAFIFALKLLSKNKPDLILGFGGFVTAGIALPGFLKGIPFALHEANRVVGRSNRFLSRFADRVFLPVGVELPHLHTEKIQFAGLPLRKEFVPMTREVAREQLGISPSKKLLVVFGGSQGAHSLNKWAQDCVGLLAEKGVSLYCLTGLRNEMPSEVVTETDSFGTVRSWFVPFSDSMPVVLSAADAIISRAGAGSIGEIVRCRVPAILVPYPFARDDHQTANAQYLVARNAAKIVEESNLACLLEEVTDLIFDDSQSSDLRENQSKMDQPDEARLLADSLDNMISSNLDHQGAAIPPTEA
jgi:UDP-N-acetylglucosamine--N-acetylmuramyl-(pentapeptide) pyrophosphoryl-undecaprenol N-acetylglucosamine transferase